MDPHDKQRLLLNVARLSDDLITSDVVPYLIQDEILTFDDKARIEHQVTPSDKAMKLVELLLAKGAKAYQSFVGALRHNQEFLAEMLEATELKNIDSGTNINDIGFLIKEELTDHYQRTLKSLSPLQWCNWFQLDFENVFTEVKLVRGVRRKAFAKIVENNKHEYINHIEDLFKPHQECVSPNRVILQGEPGIGKSTMCQKIAFDWSRCEVDPVTNKRKSSFDRTMPKYLRQFQMLFYLHARDIKQSLSDSIYEFILPEDFPVSKENFNKYIEQHQKEILFLVDGFDEINNEGVSLVNKLVQRRIFPHSTVLLTSRSQYAVHLLKYFDSLFVVKGYSAERIVEFIKKYSADMRIPMETFDSLLKSINSYSSMKEICRNPLNLCFLCVLCEERKGVLPDTRTEIYDEVVSMLKQKASVRLELSMEEIECHLKQLCELAFKGMQRNAFCFPASDFTCEKILASMGFLNKELPMTKLKNQPEHYTFTHKSFQEYLAARHVTLLPKEERNAFVKKHLRGRHMSAVWGFFCGMNRENESSLVEYFSAFEEQYCPMNLDRMSQSANRRLLHMPRNIPFDRLSVQDITSDLHIQCLKCLKEVELNNLSGTALELISRCIPHQICFSHIYVSKTALTGLLAYLKAMKLNSSYKLVVSGESFDQDQNSTVFDLFKDIAKTGKIGCVGLHMLTNAAQLKLALETFDLDKNYSVIKSLKLKFVAFVDFTETEIEGLKFGHGLESLEIYDCNYPQLLAKILEQCAEKSTQLTRLVLRNCFFNEKTVSKLATIIKTKELLSVIDFTENHLSCDKEMVVLPLMAALEARKPSLKSMSLSGMPSRQSWQPDSAYCCHANKYMKNILLTNELEYLHVSKTVLHKSSLETLTELVRKGSLKSIELEFCFIICMEAFHEFLKALACLPELRHISIKGSTIRSFTENNVSNEVFVTPMEVDQLESEMQQVGLDTVDFIEPPNMGATLSAMMIPKAEPPRYTLDSSPRPLSYMEQLSPRPRASSSPLRAKKLLAERRDQSPQRFKFPAQSISRAISVPEGMHNKVIMSNINNARDDDRSESIHILHGLLEKTTTLRSLALSDLHTDQLICLCKGLERNSTLESLALLCSNISEACTDALCKFLEKHPKIEELSVARSNMNLIKSDKFFESVSKCKSLKTLGLGHCLFHDKHMAKMANAVNKNLSICNILLRDNSKITCKGAKDLYECLKNRGKQLKILDLSDCKVTKDDEIVEQLKDISLVVKVNWF